MGPRGRSQQARQDAVVELLHPRHQVQGGLQASQDRGHRLRGCYALKGNYLFSNVKDAMERRLASLKDPRWVDAMSFLLRDLAGKKPRFFRWHDSGDLQNISHLHKIVAVAKRTPDIQHWLPTKEKGLVLSYVNPFPANLTVRLSAYHLDTTLKGEGLPTSSVTTMGDETCPAYTQGGKCGSCRKCWDPAIRNVSYPKH